MKRRIRLMHGRISEASPTDPLLARLEQLPEEATTGSPASGGLAAQQGEDASQQSRAAGLIDPEWMKQRKVAIFGAGVVGSRVSLALAPYGMGQVLIDFDLVEMANVLDGRTPYRESDLQVLKVLSLREMVVRLNPGIAAVAHPRNVNDFADEELIRLAEAVDIAVVAIDEGPALLRLNRILYPRVLALYPAGHEQARTGQVVITRPGSPCLECCMGARSGADIGTLHGEPGLGIHFAAVAQLCAQLVVQELAARRGSPLGTPVHPELGVLFISNMSSQLTPYGPGIIPFRVEQDPACEVCGN